MTSAPPHVLVAIVTYQSEAVIAAGLLALDDFFRDIATFTTVVADNASTDRTGEVVARMAPEARYVPVGRNGGYAAGINAAIAHARDVRFDAVLVLNADVRLAPRSAGPLLDALTLPGIGIAVPRLVDDAGELLPSLRREPTVLRALGEAALGGSRAGRVAALGEIVVGAERYGQPTTVAWATGAAMLISRACLEATGPWDESFFLYSEETDFCLRARDAGHATRYVPAAGAVHLGGESNTSPALWALLTLNRVRLYRSRHGRIRSAAFRGVAVLNETVRAAAGRATSRAALGALLGRAGPVPEPTQPSGPADGYVCFSAQDWWYFSHGHSDFQLMTRVARDRPVLLVNSLGMRMPKPGGTTTPGRRIARKLRSASRGLRAPLDEVPDFHVFTPLFLPAYGGGLVARCNQRLVLVQVRRALRRIGVRRPVVVVTLPTAWPIARELARERTVAYRSDRYSALPEADGALVADLERELLQAADVALFASSALLDEEGSMTRHPVLLRHGVDSDRFRPAAQLRPHPLLAGIDRPRVGYVGMIDAYTVDLDLLDRVAARRPAISVVLAGPVDVDISRLLAHNNVHHVGILPFGEVPSFLAGLDVALMPWQQNDWIRHCNPIKLKEYLAVGLPVLSTDFPEVRLYDHVVEVATDADDFTTRLDALLSGEQRSTPAQRRAAVSAETWDAQAARLIAVAEPRTDPPDRFTQDATCVAS